MYFAPQTSKPSYGPGSAKIVSAIRIFCFEGHSASRCSITSKTFFYKSQLCGPCKHFGGKSWADTALLISLCHRAHLYVTTNIVYFLMCWQLSRSWSTTMHLQAWLPRKRHLLRRNQSMRGGQFFKMWQKCRLFPR